MPRRIQDLTLGEWLPDQAPFQNPGALEVLNCVPQAQSYRSFRGPVTVSPAVPDTVLGAYWARDGEDAVEVVAGTSTALYRLSATSTWTDVSRSILNGDPADGYAGVTNWEFVRFGSQVIAVAKGVPPQVINFDDGVAAQFTGLAGSPPQAQRIAVVRDFVFLGDLDDNADRIQWSGFNNAEIWDNLPAQADFQQLFEGGRVQKIIGGAYALVFQEDMIRRFDYIQPPLIFSNQIIDRQRGTPAPNSVVVGGNQVFWYARDGFYVTDGAQSQPIGEERVNRWFIDNTSDVESLQASIDRVNKLVLWSFNSGGAGRNDKILIYNYAVNRWAHADVETQRIVEARIPGYNLDELDVPLPGGPDVDSFPMDSDVFTGGRPFAAAFNANNELIEFSGAALPATFDTTEFSLEDRRMFVTNLRPRIEAEPGTGVEATMLCRPTQQAIPCEGVSSSLNRIGEVALRADARYFRVRLRVDGDFDHAQGVAVLGRVSSRF